MKIYFIPKTFTKAHEKVIQRSNTILEEYAVHGFVPTLRQLYYQFVARGFIPNNQKQYKRLGNIIGQARLAGRIDWDHIEDRTRNLSSLQKFDDAQDALNKLAKWYHVDMWANQLYRPEVWIEKDALTGVIRRVCEENDVPYFSCRGYTSLSEMYGASQRLSYWNSCGQKPYIIHFGDHDPSGIDMSRDIVNRLRNTFMSGHQFERVALTMKQIKEYNPPPNPAKVKDSRYDKYREQFGDQSWELDSLDPFKFRELIEDRLNGIRNEAKWKTDLARKEKVKGTLTELAGDWEKVQKLMAKELKRRKAADARARKKRKLK